VASPRVSRTAGIAADRGIGYGPTMDLTLLHGNELAFAVRLGVCLVLGAIVGIERELRNKPAGISTNCFVMAGACLFTFISMSIDENSPARIAAQIVSGVGFLGAGMIIKSENNKVKNLTTAAAVWFAAAIGMAIGLGWFLLAAMATIYAVIVPRIPHTKDWLKADLDE
jgi:putative Mg2+ transporter-C (MgtC) family protein